MVIILLYKYQIIILYTETVCQLYLKISPWWWNAEWQRLEREKNKIFFYNCFNIIWRGLQSNKSGKLSKIKHPGTLLKEEIQDFHIENY